MAKRYRDFDAFIAEASGEPITIRLAGRQWSLPNDPPAREMLLRKRGQAALQRYAVAREAAEARGEELTENEEAELLVDLSEFTSLLARDFSEHAAAMLGKDNLEEMLELGVGWNALKLVVAEVEREHDQRTWGAYGEEAADGDDDEPDGVEPDDREGDALPPPGATSSPPGG